MTPACVCPSQALPLPRHRLALRQSSKPRRTQGLALEDVFVLTRNTGGNALTASSLREITQAPLCMSPPGTCMSVTRSLSLPRPGDLRSAPAQGCSVQVPLTCPATHLRGLFLSGSGIHTCCARFFTQQVPSRAALCWGEEHRLGNRGARLQTPALPLAG